MTGAILVWDAVRDSSIGKAKCEIREGKNQDSLRILNLIQSGIFPYRYVDIFGMVIQELVGNFKAHRGY